MFVEAISEEIPKHSIAHDVLDDQNDEEALLTMHNYDRSVCRSVILRENDTRAQ